ncbi:MAG: hypothetical protein V3S55_10040 [Nitrospiraceae bacterium]
MTKTETALRVIAGVSPAWAQWKMFFDTPPPKRDKVVDTAAAYQDRLSIKVRLEACRWLSANIPLDIDESRGIMAVVDTDEAESGRHDGCNHLAYPVGDEGSLLCNKCGFYGPAGGLGQTEPMPLEGILA